MVIRWVYDRPSLLNKDRNWSSKLRNREIYQQWWWQWEHRTSNTFTGQNIKFAPCIMVFCTFLGHYWTTTKWKCLLSHFMEDANKWRPIFLSYIRHFQWTGIHATKSEKNYLIFKEAFSLPLMLNLPNVLYWSCFLIGSHTQATSLSSEGLNRDINCQKITSFCW